MTVVVSLGVIMYHLTGVYIRSTKISTRVYAKMAPNWELVVSLEVIMYHLKGVHTRACLSMYPYCRLFSVPRANRGAYEEHLRYERFG